MDITSLAGMLPTYPSWVRSLMLGTSLLWIVTYVLLLHNAPPPPKKDLVLSKFEQVMAAGGDSDLLFAVSVVNNTGETIPLNKARLIFYEGEVSYSGLQSSNTVSTRYRVYNQGDKLVSESGDELVKLVDTELKMPYAGQAQMHVDLSIDQIVEDKKGDRFLIEFPDRSVLIEAIDSVEIELDYGVSRSVKASTRLQ